MTELKNPTIILDDSHHKTFLDLYEQYHDLSTDAPLIFANFLACQMIGHAMRRGAKHAIQPEFQHHNVYMVLCGVSTDTRKDTSQNKARQVYPSNNALPEEFSPERLIQELSENSHRVGWMGEFTSLLKQIRRPGYMSHMVELLNTLFGCPEEYTRSIRGKGKKGETYTIKSCYLSLNATCTPKMLKRFLTDEIMEGGFLARWIIVYGEPRVRDRGRLLPEVDHLQNRLNKILIKIFNLFNEKEIYFEFTDEALKRFNKLDNLGRKYTSIRPIAARYINYLIPLADILLISDLVGLEEFTQLEQLEDLVELVNRRMIDNETNSSNSSNSTNSILVSSKFVEQAWEMIKPQIEYTKTLGEYVELDLPTAKLRSLMEDKYDWISHSDVLRSTGLSAAHLRNAVQTLVQANYIEIKQEESIDQSNRKRMAIFYRRIKTV